MHDPLVLDSRSLLLDHHARLAVVETEQRECRADVAELHAAIAEVGNGVRAVQRAVDGVAADVGPLVAAATARHQQTSTLLMYTFSASLGVGGGSLSAWLATLAHLAGAGEVAIPLGAGIVCIGLARVLIGHSTHR